MPRWSEAEVRNQSKTKAPETQALRQLGLHLR